MAGEQRPAMGLSIGATNLAAVTADRALTRRPVLTLYGQHPPEVGVPSENPKLTEPGLVITDFVGRAGDPAGVVAADGTVHRGETLLADALRALAYAATDGRALPTVAVACPAHWGRPAVDALRAALSRVPEWSGNRVRLLPDYAAALSVLRTDPGLPARGIIAVCDFGGSGTSLTLVDAADRYRPVAPTVRHAGFGGDAIDQALLNHVVADASSAGGPDVAGTATIGSVSALRAACRHAKEELSTATSTTVTVDLARAREEIRLTRAELDDLVRQPLAGFVDLIRETLQCNEIHVGDLTEVVSVGGGASVPAVTMTLSGQLRVPVISAPRPQLAAAIGAALTAARGPADAGATALAPTAGPGSPTDPTAMTDVVPQPDREAALAWSEADDGSGIVPIRAGEYPVAPGTGVGADLPHRVVEQAGGPRETRAPALPWYRRPTVVIIGTALVVLAVGAAILIALRHASGSSPATPSPSVSTTPGPGTSAPGTQSSGPSASSGTETPSSTSSSSVPSTTTSSSTTATTSTTTSTTTQTTTTTTQPSTTTPTATTTAPTSSGAPQYPRFPLFPGRRGFGPQPGQPGG